MPSLRTATAALAVALMAAMAAAAAAGVIGKVSPWPAAPAPRASASASGSASARHVVAAAERLTDVTPQDYGFRLVVAGPRPDLRAQTDLTARTVTLFVAAGAAPHRIAHDLAHEVGHIVDACCLADAARSAYLRERRAPAGTPWRARTVSDYATGAGDFAEIFALCHATSPEFRSTVAPRPADACATLPVEARSTGRGTP